MAYTWNPSDKGASITLSGGNLTATSGSSWNTVRSTGSKSSGKWYWEITINDASYNMVGVATASASLSNYSGSDNYGLGLGVGDLGGWWKTAGSIFTSQNKTAPNGAVGCKACIALDLDNGKIWFGINGTWADSGNPSAGTGECFTFTPTTLYPTYSPQTSNATANFGSSAFSYTVPTGFTGISLIEGSTSETATLTDTSEALHLVDSTSEAVTLTDTAEALHLVDSTSETATLTDTASRVIETQRSTAETATLTDTHSRVIVTQRDTTETATLSDVAEALHLVDLTSETATLTDVANADELIRKKIRFPNLQGKHLSLKFTSATDGSFAIYYLRHKMFKTRELTSDQKHPNTQGSHLGIKLSNSGSDEFILMYVSEEMQLVTT